MRVINDIANDILIKGQEHISLTLDEVHTLFGTNDEDFQAAVDFLSVQDNVDPERIGIIGICGLGGVALQTACQLPILGSGSLEWICYGVPEGAPFV